MSDTITQNIKDNWISGHKEIVDRPSFNRLLQNLAGNDDVLMGNQQY